MNLPGLGSMIVLYLAEISLAAKSRSEVRGLSQNPAPIVVAATQNYNGNDGPWSTFPVQIGNPPQVIEVLISTASEQTWAILPQGCTDFDPPNCVELRGNEFNPNSSRTWTRNNVTSTGIFELSLESELGYTGDAAYGYDTIQLGWPGSNGSSLSHQIVAGISTKEFFLGILGVNPRSTNFTTFDDPVPSFLSSLKQDKMIPSLSWSYTAGNQYRPGPFYGSLTLGGYDSSLFVPNNVSFAFSKIDLRDLTVIVNDITMTTSNMSISLMAKAVSIPAFIDSTIPYLYLPLTICEAFEDAFGLTWNDTVQAYLVNDSLHEVLQAQNPSVMFSLSSTNSSTEQMVNISLPYAAFDLLAEYPLMINTTRYFPLMRAANESQYTLGRTFLQEAYLIADYERHKFSVSQCSWDSRSSQHVVEIAPLKDNQEAVLRHFPTGDIAGITVGSVIGLALVASVVILRVQSVSKRTKDMASDVVKLPEKVEPVMLAAEADVGAELDDTMLRGYELDTRLHKGHEIEGVALPRHEMDGRANSKQSDGTKQQKYELPANECPASELPHA